MVGERIDLAHQRRFCMTSAHTGCPFLMVSASETGRDWPTRARAWWRFVSPAHSALTAAQLGHMAGLGAAAVGNAAQLTLQTWRTVRPQANHPDLIAHEVPDHVLAQEVLAQEVLVEEDPTPVAVLEPVGSADMDAREWFWRAKNADTLDELVACLERAHGLEPGNAMIASNLEWAILRRDAQREANKAKRAKAPQRPPAATVWTAQSRPGPALRALALILDLCRATLALAAFVVAAALLCSSLPEQAREALLSTIGVPAWWLPDAGRVTSLVRVPLGGGYDLGQALPYTLGFLAMFVGMGLLHREPSPSGRR
jgi:hypothetical protein